MKTKLSILGALVALFCFGVATAATKGDPNPFGAYGIIQCPDDAGNGLVPMRNGQNAIAVRNFISDGGTAQTIYIGFDTSMNFNTGFPVKDQETLSVDVVAAATGRVVTAPTNIDGGTTNTLSTITPTLYCKTKPGVGAQDLRYILVR